jgi:hypothetical protein
MRLNSPLNDIHPKINGIFRVFNNAKNFGKPHIIGTIIEKVFKLSFA